MAQSVKMLTTSPDDLNSTLRFYVVEGENWVLQVVL